MGTQALPNQDPLRGALRPRAHLEAVTHHYQKSYTTVLRPEIALLMSEVGYDINQNSVLTSGKPPLIQAVINKHGPSVRLYLEAPGIDVNRPTSIHGQTPLYIATCQSDEACIRLEHRFT